MRAGAVSNRGELLRYLIALLLLSIASAASAQLPNEDYRGAAATGLALRKLATTQRVLVIGAHPDDEDTQLLSILSLAQGVDVAYLSLTRGEGGQNTIGNELGTGLGVVRTGELLAARELDRGAQFFTRAIDFGFAKTAEETLQHWPRDSVLGDVVAVVRRYRPDVIVAIFTGTARDGHGQHQVSGMLAREAFSAAADANRFTQQITAGLRPHTTARLFQATGYRQGDPTQVLQTGVLDPLLGRSYAQIAAASRSRHRSQDMGQAQTLGPRATSVRLIEATVAGSDSTLFAGIPVTLSQRAQSAKEGPAVVRLLQHYDSLIAKARSSFSAFSTDNIATTLSAAVSDLRSAAATVRDNDLQFLILAELAEAEQAFLRAAGVVVDAVASREIVVPGSSFNLDVTLWNGGRSSVSIQRLEPELPAGWRYARTDSSSDAPLSAGSVVTRRFRIDVPANAQITQPYFLQGERKGDVYAWPARDASAGLPFQDAPVRALATVTLEGIDASARIDATRRIVDQRQGELRRAIHVAPAFTVRVHPVTSVVTLAALASGSNKPVDVSVDVLSNGAGGNVVVKPQLPAGWRATPEQVAVRLGAGDEGSAQFAIRAPRSAAAGKYSIGFIVTDSAGSSYSLTQQPVDYAHIVNRLIFEPALLHVTVLDAAFARSLRVGYVIGTDPSVPEVLEQMGILVERLSEAKLASSELGRFDAIVVGSRAYEVRPDLVAHNGRVLDYARKGGNLVVLYQQYEFIQGNYAPFALTLSRPHDRIVDENSPVRILDATARALTVPNRISDRDFAGWVQERALYMPNTWAEQYKPLLEMSDPGEAPKQGALLVAPFGTGLYTYTGIAFFREVPAGVPGALRLFINLLSQGARDAVF